MAIETTWHIANLEHRTDDGGVVVAHWRVNAVDGEHSASAYGTASFIPDPTASGFVPFEQLTEETVLGWVKAELNTGEIEQALANKLNEKLNPTVMSGIPWSAEE